MLEGIKQSLRFRDKHLSFLIIIVGVILFLISFYAAYLFLVGEYNITKEFTSFAEPALHFGFLGLMIWISSLVTKRGIEFYGETH